MGEWRGITNAHYITRVTQLKGEEKKDVSNLQQDCDEGGKRVYSCEECGSRRATHVRICDYNCLDEVEHRRHERICEEIHT